MAGCQSMPEPAAPFTTVTVPEALTVATAAPLIAPPPLVVLPILPIITPTVTSPPPALVTKLAWPTNWINNAWIPLEGWGKYNQLGRLAQSTSGPNSTYEYRTSNGVLSVRMGSRIAHCDGLECWLGYIPKAINGLPYVYSLDAQKTFQPLLNTPNLHLKTNRTIVLDAGHGGKDSGARNAFSQRYEKEYTLDWANRLSKILATNGWKVVMIRSIDVDAPLPDRVALAERVNADLFLSLHFNSGLPNRALAGIETYCLTPAGLPSNLIRNYEDDKKQKYPNNLFDEENFQFAFRLHRGLVQTVCAIDRGVRRARFMGVLRGQNRPAVLIEGGYLSNPAEAKKIAAAAYRQSLAEAVAKALE